MRVAERLLEERGKGEESAYAPFIRSLPWGAVATPLQYAWETTQGVQFAHTRKELHELRFLVDHWYEEHRRKEKADGGAQQGGEAKGTPNVLLGDFEAAMTLTHSRTFLACVEEGAGNSAPWFARVLVPLGDMINHAPEGGGRNAVWSFEDGVEGEGKAMVFRAAREIAAGEEVLADYGHKSCDHLFLYYGFVPSCMPNDSVPLFEDATEALEWWLVARGEEGNPQALERARQLLAWLEGGGHTAAQEAARGVEPASSGSRDSTDGLCVHLQGRVDAQLLEAFIALELACGVDGQADSDGDALLAVADTMVRRRCAELLRSTPTSLKSDLELLGVQPRDVNAAAPFGAISELPEEACGAACRGSPAQPTCAADLSEEAECVTRYNAAKKLVLCAVLVEEKLAPLDA